MQEKPFHLMTLSELSDRIHTGALSPITLTEYFLSRIEAFDHQLHAYRLVCRERAMGAAQAAEAALRAGQDFGPLHGIPFAVKDLFDVKGLPTTAGTHLLQDNIAAKDAFVVHKLFQAGMILLGKTHTVQFAYGGVGINHDHGTPYNPWKKAHFVPGGSSSGSAVAVASGMTPVALGTDTGGSVRIPASLCGITGLKTTVGRVSRHGVYPLSWTLDSVGPLTRSVEDAAIVYQHMHGADPKDETTHMTPMPQNVLKDMNRGIRGLRLAFPDSIFWDNTDPEVEKAVRVTGDVFKSLGASVDTFTFKEAEAVQDLKTQVKVAGSEVYSINRSWLEKHYEQLDPIVAERILKGRDTRASDYIQEYRNMRRIQTKALHTLKDIDALLVPATVIPAAAVSQVDADMETYMKYNISYLRNTSIGNMLNLCGLSLPCGFTKEGLPIGLMVYAKPFDEDLLLRLGNAFQKETTWHKQVPDLADVR